MEKMWPAALHRMKVRRYVDRFTSTVPAYSTTFEKEAFCEAFRKAPIQPDAFCAEVLMPAKLESSIHRII